MSPKHLIPAAVLTLAACGGTEITGNGAGIAMRAVTSTPASDTALEAIAFQDDSGRTYTATQILVRVGEIELELPDGMRCAEIEAELAGGAVCDHHTGTDDSGHHDGTDDDDDEIRIPGPFIVDLLAGTSTPSLDAVRVPALTYREVEFDLADRPGDGDLDGHSFALRATFDDGGTPAELHLRLGGSLDIEIERPEGIPVQSDAQLLVLLDASRWLQGAPLQACIDDAGLPIENGVLSIDESTGCDDFEDALEDRFEDSCSFDADDDRDGDIDDDHGGDSGSDDDAP